MGEANSSQGFWLLTPPEEGLVAFFFCAWLLQSEAGSRPSTERLRTSKHEQQALQSVTKPLGICCISSQALPMTDYSTAIFGLIAFTGVVSAAVVYILAQPSDLPVVKKAKAAQN